jgi:hypothetical protein
MNGDSGTTRYEIADEMSGWLVGGGLITMVLFPLALPLIVLTVVATIPLVLVALAGALAVAVVAAPVLLVRGLARRATRALRASRPAAGEGVAVIMPKES